MVSIDTLESFAELIFS